MHFAFPLEDFLARFPEFDSDKYKLPYLQSIGQKAMMHILPSESGMPMHGPYRHYALFLMAAHLIELDDLSEPNEDGTPGTGGIAGTPYKATIGSVQIEASKQNSFTMDDWSWWLGQTKHGRELLAYLDIQAPCGIFLNTCADSVRDLI